MLMLHLEQYKKKVYLRIKQYILELNVRAQLILSEMICNYFIESYSVVELFSFQLSTA